LPLLPTLQTLLGVLEASVGFSSEVDAHLLQEAQLELSMTMNTLVCMVFDKV